MEIISNIVMVWFGLGFLTYLLCVVESLYLKEPLFPESLKFELLAMVTMTLMGAYTFVDFFIYTYKEYFDYSGEDEL